MNKTEVVVTSNSDGQLTIRINNITADTNFKLVERAVRRQIAQRCLYLNKGNQSRSAVLYQLNRATLRTRLTLWKVRIKKSVLANLPVVGMIFTGEFPNKPRGK